MEAMSLSNSGRPALRNTERDMAQRLRRLKIGEVSWVDRPANLRRFTVVKSAPDELTKASPLKVEFSIGEDGPADVRVNGKSIDNLVDLSLGYRAGMGEVGPDVWCSYSVAGKEKAGFQAIETYQLSKGEIELVGSSEEPAPATDDELAKVRTLVEDLPGDVDGELVRSLGSNAEIIAAYVDDLPVDLKKAVVDTMRLACLTEAVKESNDVTVEKNEEAAPETSEELTNEQPKTDSEPKPTSPSVVRLADDQLDSVVQRVTDKVTEALAANAASAPKSDADDGGSEMVEFDDEDALLDEITSAAVEAVAGDD